MQISLGGAFASSNKLCCGSPPATNGGPWDTPDAACAAACACLLFGFCGLVTRSTHRPTYHTKIIWHDFVVHDIDAAYNIYHGPTFVPVGGHKSQSARTNS